jgi:acetyl esterase/lipase
MDLKLTVAVALFFLAGLLGCSPQRITADQDIAGIGDADPEQLERTAFGFNLSAEEQLMDMGQFERTALDIPYTTLENDRQTLDIVFPEGGEPPYKTIILFHGGGWMAGDKQSETIAPVFHATKQGYAVVSANYRLSGEATWPKPLHDAKAVIRFVRANADKYELDAEKLVVWGVSSGGHLASMLAATNHQPEFEDYELGSPEASSAVQGVVSWYGVYDVSGLSDTATPAADALMGYDVRMKKARNANPIGWVTDNYPPALLIHGTEDQVVPFEQSEMMKAKVIEATGEQRAELIPVPGAGHGDTLIRNEEMVERCLDFVDGILFGGENPNRR